MSHYSKLITWKCTNIRDMCIQKEKHATAAHFISLRWRHNGHDCVSNHQPHHCLLNRLFRRRSKKTSKLRVTGLFAGNSPGTGEFPAQRANNAKMFPFDDVIMILSLIIVMLAISDAANNKYHPDDIDYFPHVLSLINVVCMYFPNAREWSSLIKGILKYFFILIHKRFCILLIILRTSCHDLGHRFTVK